MTEVEWLACTEPRQMLDLVRESGRASDRKLRLFACACARRVWGLLRHSWSKKAIEVAESFADGQGTAGRLDSWWSRAGRAVPAGGPREMHAAESAQCALEENEFNLGVGAAHHAAAALGVGERATQARLVRDIIGNPFSPTLFDPAWRAPTVFALTHAAYDHRQLPEGTLEPVRLAVLPDALEEGGYANPDLLSHLRGSGPHFRGCWPVDAVLRWA
jgi:hypothetical protein